MSLRNFASSGRKIVAIGRNYADHAKELNNAVPKAPFFFLKPTSSYLQSGNVIVPRGCDVHHEGYALAIDMTARNLQNEAKKKGLPWSAAKGFDTFTPISTFIEKSEIPDPHNVDLWIKLDGQIKQQGNTKDMLFNIPSLLAYVSSIMRLEVGDLLITGTPAGVGPIKAGQRIEAGLRRGGEHKDILTMQFGVEDSTGRFSA